jgi:hypothetical protein
MHFLIDRVYLNKDLLKSENFIDLTSNNNLKSFYVKGIHE